MTVPNRETTTVRNANVLFIISPRIILFFINHCFRACFILNGRQIL